MYMFQDFKNIKNAHSIELSACLFYKDGLKPYLKNEAVVCWCFVFESVFFAVVDVHIVKLH